MFGKIPQTCPWGINHQDWVFVTIEHWIHQECGATNSHKHVAVCQNLVPLVNIKIAGKWMFIPLKMVLIGIDPYPCGFYVTTKVAGRTATHCQEERPDPRPVVGEKKPGWSLKPLVEHHHLKKGFVIICYNISVIEPRSGTSPSIGVFLIWVIICQSSW